ncbi:MAG: HAD hydrolase family protein [Chitinivibrionales bacterium]
MKTVLTDGGMYVSAKCTQVEVAYIGDDLNDFNVMRKAGVAVTVPDGDMAIKKIAHYVTKHRGGNGAVRELCDLILTKRNQ